jgi:hypothetical protein
MCKCPLNYLKGSETIWECSSCFQFYDTRIQDTPLKNITEPELRPFADLMHYPTADSENVPFFEAINPDKQDAEEGLEQRIYQDPSVQTIHVKGSFADAILKGAFSSKKQNQEED